MDPGNDPPDRPRPPGAGSRRGTHEIRTRV